MAAPQSWVSVNLATETVDEAARNIQLRGVDVATVEGLMQAGLAHHPVFVFDVASSASDPKHFARNLSAFCTSSGITETGSTAAGLVKEALKSEFATMASDITQRDIMIGGVPGLETSYKLNTGLEDIREAQLEVLPKPNVVCIVSLAYTPAEGAGNVLDMAAATAQFPPVLIPTTRPLFSTQSPSESPGNAVS